MLTGSYGEGGRSIVDPNQPFAAAVIAPPRTASTFVKTICCLAVPGARRLLQTARGHDLWRVRRLFVGNYSSWESRARVESTKRTPGRDCFRNAPGIGS